MNVGVIIPTRGDRKQFLDYAYKQISRQIRKPDSIILVNDPPKNKNKDITYRYKIGVKRAVDRGCDIMFFWEDDDWYSNDYIDWMLKRWVEHGKPNIFGINETYYYHIGAGKCLYMKHEGRASMFCTIVTPEANRFRWPPDHYPFVDMKIWKNMAGKSIPFGNKIRAVGIKHGIGMVGGGGHNRNFKWSNHNALQWFNETVDERSRLFYDRIRRENRL